MAYLENKRASSGAVMPFVAMSLCLLLITAGICVDLMRAFETVHQLEFGAQTAALYGLSLATNADGSYAPAQAQANIQAAVNFVANNSWNSAQTGPQGVGGVWSKPVTFSSTQFVPNPLDPSEFFVRVTSQRIGTDALQQFFIPLAYVGLPNSGANPPPQVQTTSLTNTVEVLGQPANRIGNGAPIGSPAGTRAGDLVGFAALPIAVSNAQFASIASPTQTTSTYTIDLVTSASTEYPQGQAPPAGHIKGCLVNVAGTGAGAGYYGPGLGDTAAVQLQGLLGYFGAKSAQPTIAPAVVEQGSLLNGFDPANASNSTTDVAQVFAALAKLPAPHVYIIPVLLKDPSFTVNNQVVGFAYLKLDAPFVAPINNATPGTLTVDIVPSVPVRNASSAAGYSSIPGNAGNLMPAPVAPFGPRAIDALSNGIQTRPRAVVLSPAVSPRQLAPPVVPTR